MSDETDPTPADRISAAIKGLPAKALPPVLAGDVVAVAALVPPAAMTKVTSSLAKGAANHLKGLSEEKADALKIHPQAGDLKLLLEAAGVVTQ